MFQEAKWITCKEYRKLDSPMPYIRKAFWAEKEMEKATLNICAVGYGVCYINGQPVTEDVLTTPISAYDKTTYYNEYDITELIHTGENVIGVILGNGWYNDPCTTWKSYAADWRDFPKLLAEIIITYKDGSTETVSSNSSWKTKPGPLLYNHARSGELYDARCEIAGWNLPGLSDEDWDPAKVRQGTGGILKKTSMPPIRRIRTIKPVLLKNGVYDLQENISGWVKFRVQGNPGDELKIIYAERRNPDGTIDNSNENELNVSLNRVHSDQYLLKGGEPEDWEPLFTYHGFRYFTAEGTARLLDVEAVLVHTDLTCIGDFECGDEILNKLHKASVQSTLTNYFSIPTDCPQREQLGWTGDAVISAEQSIMNFDMLTAYTKWMEDFRDAQRPDGQLPCIVPTTGWGWGGGPAWDCAFILIPYYIYLYTGEKKLIEDHFDAFEKYMNYLYTAGDDYIVGLDLGDWNPPSRKRIDHRITSTCYYHTLAVVMGKCAGLLGRDPSPYISLSENIKRSYREKFLLNDLPDMHTQTAVACSIYHGLYEKEEIPAAAAKLVQLIQDKDYHFDTGFLGTKAMFTVLTENGYIDVLYKMISNPTQPSYAYWIHNGMTTLCERWNMDKSHNHHVFSEIDFWFYKYLAGIRLSQDGIVIAPYFLEDIKWVRCHHKEIQVYWDESKVIVQVPKKACLILDGQSIQLNPGENIIPRNQA